MPTPHTVASLTPTPHSEFGCECAICPGCVEAGFRRRNGVNFSNRSIKDLQRNFPVSGSPVIKELIAGMPLSGLASVLDNHILPILKNNHLEHMLDSQSRSGISLRAQLAFFADFFFSEGEPL
jgi:hypothetical protein